MTFMIIKTIHLFAAFIYGGFLITDNLFLSKIKRSFDTESCASFRVRTDDHFPLPIYVSSARIRQCL